MSAQGLLLGVINIGIVAALWILVGLVIVWLLKLIAGIDVPENIRRIYLIVVALVVIYMVAGLLFGLPTWRVV